MVGLLSMANAQKTETMTISMKKIDKPDPPPSLHGQQLHLFCFRTYTSWTSYFRQRELGKHIDRTTEKLKLRESIS